MKVVIFAGGLGTRLMEETNTRPKPMVEIGGRPILWHIMKMYYHQGFNDFVICLGYKGETIKEYFLNYYMHNSDVTIDLDGNNVQVHTTKSEAFRVTLVDTGLNTMTAGRLLRVRHHVQNERFMLTYGDGLSDVNFHQLLKFHESHGKAASLTAIQLGGRYGALDIDNEACIQSFIEKPKGDGLWINGGFFVLEPNIFDFIPEDSDKIMWETSPMQALSAAGELFAYKHEGFWKCMDALRDKIELEEIWNSGKPAWKNW
jgi:glucose-1-phosphate cytidylyltransferase